jgi:hypothetical protein
MFTLYVYGDVNMFYMVLNAVAMVFNSSMFNTSSGAGAFLIGGLVSVIVVTSRSIFHSSSDFKPAYLMTLFLFFFAGVNVKTTVQIEDVFTGTVSSVANIPMFVAAPAGIISAAANGITTAIETAFTTPAPSSSFTALSLGAEGFVNPLRLLISLRCDEFACPAADFPYQARSLQSFLLHCAMPSSGFSQSGLETATDVVSYLTGLTVSGISVYYSATYPNGVGMDCVTEASTLNTDIGNLFAGANAKILNIDVYQKMLKTAPGQNNPSQTPTWTTGDIQSSFTAIVNGSASQMMAQSSQAYMSNMMFMDSLENTFKCSSSAGTLNSFNICVDSVMERDALEKMKVDDSAAGSIFARTMFPAMNLLLMLFYGFSPLVALVAMMMSGGGQGFKVVFQYFLFGAWVQSWTPVAAIINYYMQLQASQAAMAAGLTSAGLSIRNAHMFYDALGMKIALGANMLAATPILTYALISGSVMSMTSAIGAIAGKDKVDESQGAPTLEGGNAVTQVGAANSKPVQNADRTDVLGLGAKPGMDTFSMGTNQMTEAAEQVSAKRVDQTAQGAAVEVAHAISTSNNTSDVVAHARQTGQDVRHTNTQSAKAMTSMVDKLGDSVNLSQDKKDAVLGAVSTAANGGMLGADLVAFTGALVGAAAGTVFEPVGGTVAGAMGGWEVGKKVGENIFGASPGEDGKGGKSGVLKLNAEVKSGSESSAARSKKLDTAMTEQIQRTREYNNTHSQDAFAGVTDTTTHGTNHTTGTTDSTGLKSSISATKAAVVEHANAVSRKNSMGSGVKVNGEQLVAGVIHDEALQGAIRNDMVSAQIAAQNDPAAKARYTQQKAMANAIQRQFGLTDDTDQARLAAWAVAGTKLGTGGAMAEALDQHFNGEPTSYEMGAAGEAVQQEVHNVGGSTFDTVTAGTPGGGEHKPDHKLVIPASHTGHGGHHGGGHPKSGSHDMPNASDLTPPPVPAATGGDPAMPDEPMFNQADKDKQAGDRAKLQAEADERAKKEGQGTVAKTEVVSPMTAGMRTAESVSPNTVSNKDGGNFDSKD